jgi:hypothetical protein
MASILSRGHLFRVEGTEYQIPNYGVIHVDSSSGVIYNEQGGVPDVVHQYDRPGREAMMDSFVRMYGDHADCTAIDESYPCN